MATDKLPVCNDKRKCGLSTNKSGRKKCTCLHTTYPDGECPFCKEDPSYTNGKWYPYVNYSVKG